MQLALAIALNAALASAVGVSEGVAEAVGVDDALADELDWLGVLVGCGFAEQAASARTVDSRGSQAILRIQLIYIAPTACNLCQQRKNFPTSHN
jgi:hypothetical protein